jgi:ribosomal protein L11 methyltransferase
VQSILFRVEAANDDALLAEIGELGCTGTFEEARGLRAFFRDDVSLKQLADAFEQDVIEVRLEEDEPNLYEFERSRWDPVFVGERFMIAPSWISSPTPPGRIRLTIDSAISFGTGRHESTQLALRAIEKHLRPGAVVFDVGCGSGILSQAAVHLGAGDVFSCDVHPVATARRHSPIPVFLGSAEAVRDTVADVVIANISTLVLDAIHSELNRIAKADAALILAGFVKQQAPLSFMPFETLEQDEWLCWICRPDDATRPRELLSKSSSFAEKWW